MTSVRVKLTFPEHLVRQPLLARVVREFNVMPNIRRANVDNSANVPAFWVGNNLGASITKVEPLE